jgi:hypothetical protein
VAVCWQAFTASVANAGPTRLQARNAATANPAPASNRLDLLFLHSNLMSGLLDFAFIFALLLWWFLFR